MPTHEWASAAVRTTNYEDETPRPAFPVSSVLCRGQRGQRCSKQHWWALMNAAPYSASDADSGGETPPRPTPQKVVDDRPPIFRRACCCAREGAFCVQTVSLPQLASQSLPWLTRSRCPQRPAGSMADGCKQRVRRGGRRKTSQGCRPATPRCVDRRRCAAPRWQPLRLVAPGPGSRRLGGAAAGGERAAS